MTVAWFECRQRQLVGRASLSLREGAMDGWAFAYLPDSFNLGSVRAIMPQGVLFRWKQSGQNLVNWQTHIPGTLGMINSGSLLLTMQRVCHRWHETKFPGRCPSHPPLQVCIEFPLSILCISSFFSPPVWGGALFPGYGCNAVGGPLGQLCYCPV